MGPLGEEKASHHQTNISESEKTDAFFYWLILSKQGRPHPKALKQKNSDVFSTREIFHALGPGYFEPLHHSDETPTTQVFYRMTQ